jgi:D-galactarolactone cycloisomerase
MKIDRIETYVVRQTLKNPFFFSQWKYGSRAACLVKVISGEGVYGWGEGYGPAGVVQAGIQFLEPLVLNQNPLHEERIWRMLYDRSLDYARRGVLVAAISAIDIALWDLKAKILGQPVSVLLGGRQRDRVRVYATGLYFTEGRDLHRRLADEASMYAQQGFSAVKMKVGLGIEQDIQNVKAVREALGPDAGLMVDANHAFSRSEAAELARHISPLRIGWFEEPLSPEDYEGYRELRQRTEIPIAGGECEYLCAGFRHLVQNQCVDIAQPDICAAGGLSEVKKIIALVNAFGVNVTPHSWGTGIAFSAALHLASTLQWIPGRLNAPEPLLEMDRSENPLRDELTKPGFAVDSGYVGVPSVPGLGVDVDPECLKRFQEL